MKTMTKVTTLKFLLKFNTRKKGNDCPVWNRLCRCVRYSYVISREVSQVW